MQDLDELANLLPSGTMLEGKYRIGPLLGRGGMGVVLQGWDELLDRPVAVKLLRHGRCDDEDGRERLRREAAAMARLCHPNVAQVHTLGHHDDHLFIVLEYVQGISVRQLIEASTQRGRPLGGRLVGALLLQACAGLAHAHELGLVHRDVKPANMMITAEGRLVLLDFGLAKGLADPSITQPGKMLGTPAYSAPELVYGLPIPADELPLVDIYSLGATAYEMLTGARPFPSYESIEARLPHIDEPPPNASLRRPDLGRGWDDLLLRALAVRSHERYQSVDELQRLLLQLPDLQGLVPSEAAREAMRGLGELMALFPGGGRRPTDRFGRTGSGARSLPGSPPPPSTDRIVNLDTLSSIPLRHQAAPPSPSLLPGPLGPNSSTSVPVVRALPPPPPVPGPRTPSPPPPPPPPPSSPAPEPPPPAPARTDTAPAPDTAAETASARTTSRTLSPVHAWILAGGGADGATVSASGVLTRALLVGILLGVCLFGLVGLLARLVD